MTPPLVSQAHQFIQNNKKGKFQIIGIHGGCDNEIKVNFASVITPAIKNWIEKKIKDQTRNDNKNDSLKRVRNPTSKNAKSSKKLTKLLRTIYQREVQIDSEFEFTLGGDSSKDKEFIKKSNNMRFPCYKKLKIMQIDWFNPGQEHKELIEFLVNSTPKQIESVQITSSVLKTPIESYMEGLETVFKSAIEKAHLTTFSINEESLSKIFAKSSKLKQLVINWWEIDISSDFKINWEIDYNIEELDFYMTKYKPNSEFPDKNKLEWFVKALSKTSLKSTLKKFIVTGCCFSGLKTKKVMKKYGFIAEIKDEKNSPF